MDQRPHKVIRLVPTPKRESNAIPPEFLRPLPAETEKKAPPTQVVVITTPPEWKNQQKEETSGPNEGLQHHFISRGSLINTEDAVLTEEESFGEKYVDVVDTEVVKTEESEHTQSYQFLGMRVKRIYMIFTVLMMLDASFSGLAMYSFDHTDRSYAHQSLAYIYTNKIHVYSHIVVLMFVIASFPLVGIAILAYPKPKPKIIFHGRWGYFIIFELYLVICMIVYCVHTNGFYEIMKKNMIKDLGRTPDNHLKPGHNHHQPFIMLRDFSQDYYGCCGVYGYKDWTEKMRDNLLDRGGYPVGCCDKSAPKECFPPLYETATENGLTRTLIHREGCLEYEARWTYSISIIYLIILFSIVVATSATPVYIYNVVALANKHNIDLVELTIP